MELGVLAFERPQSSGMKQTGEIRSSGTTDCASGGGQGVQIWCRGGSQSSPLPQEELLVDLDFADLGCVGVLGVGGGLNG